VRSTVATKDRPVGNPLAGFGAGRRGQTIRQKIAITLGSFRHTIPISPTAAISRPAAVWVIVVVHTVDGRELAAIRGSIVTLVTRSKEVLKIITGTGVVVPTAPNPVPTVAITRTIYAVRLPVAVSVSSFITPTVIFPIGITIPDSIGTGMIIELIQQAVSGDAEIRRIKPKPP
jgi:hypothetical protein